MVHDVVHVGGPGADAPLGALPAERLPEELLRPELVQPLVSPVHPAPGLGLLAAVVGTLRAVRIAVSTRYQDTAPWMLARPERLHGHGLSPPRRNAKNSGTSIHPFSGWLLAPEFNSLALVDIQDDRALAVPAEDLQAPGLRLRQHAHQPVIPLAARA